MAFNTILKQGPQGPQGIEGKRGLPGLIGPPGPLLPWLNRAVQYVSATGNDSNDGLGWATAKQSISAAYDYLYGLTPKGGEIHYGDGAIGPLWIRSDGWELPGWKQQMNLRLVGHGGASEYFGYGPVAQMTGASNTDRQHPLLWNAGTTGTPIVYENVAPIGVGLFLAATPFRCGWDYNRELDGSIARKAITSWARTTPGAWPTSGPPGVAILTVDLQTPVPITSCSRDVSNVVTLTWTDQYPKRVPRFAKFIVLASTDAHFPSGTYAVLSQPTDNTLTYSDVNAYHGAGGAIGTWASHGINIADRIEVISTTSEVAGTSYKVTGITATTVTVTDYYGYTGGTWSATPTITVSNPGTYVLEDRALYPTGQVEWKNIQALITELESTDRMVTGPTFDMGSSIDLRLRLVQTALTGDVSDTILDPDRSAWLVCDAGSSINGTGMSIYDARPNGTGIRIHANASSWGLIVRDLQGDLDVGSLIQYPTIEVVSGNATGYLDCERVSTADATGTVPPFITTGMDPNQIRLISCGANSSAGHIDGIQSSAGWAAEIVDSPYKMKQVCWWADQRVAGKHPASTRTLMGLNYARYQNLAHNNPALPLSEPWQLNGITATTGQPDPMGGNNAINLTYSGYQNLQIFPEALYPPATAGLRWVFGCWVSRVSGLANGNNGTVLQLEYPGHQVPFNVLAACPFLGDGEWQ